MQGAMRFYRDSFCFVLVRKTFRRLDVEMFDGFDAQRLFSQD